MCAGQSDESGYSGGGQELEQSVSDREGIQRAALDTLQKKKKLVCFCALEHTKTCFSSNPK